MVEGKLDLTPRYRQKVRFVPLGMGEPVWIDDPHFNIDYHLRHSARALSGRREQLRRHGGAGLLPAPRPLKPLWEIWMVEGLEDERWALLSKVHHCMVDGVAATDMMSLMFGESPEPTNGEAWQPEPEPSGLDLIAYSARHRVRDPAAQLRFALRAPTEALRGLPGRHGPGRAQRRRCARRPRPSPGRSGRTASGAGRRSPLADVKEVRAGARRHGQRRGAHPDHERLPRAARAARRADRRDTAIRTMVPVSVRIPGERGEYNNRVSAVFARLPVGIDDPAERLGAIREQMDGIKSLQAGRRRRCARAALWLRAAAPARPRQPGRRRAPRGSTWTRRPPTCPGRSARSTPSTARWSPLSVRADRGTIRIVVAIFSYNGELYFGVTGDRRPRARRRRPHLGHRGRRRDAARSREPAPA